MTPQEIWQKIKRQLAAMTDEQKRQTLISAGILDSNGEISEPYKNIINERKI